MLPYHSQTVTLKKKRKQCEHSVITTRKSLLGLQVKMKSFTVHIHSPHVPVHWCLHRVTSEDVTSALLSGRVSVAECLQLDAVEVACTFLPAARCM